MKQNNNNRRARGRGPRKPHGMGGGHNKGQGFENSGHETRVRGNAYQVLEKYLQLARDAGSAGDRVAAENFLQHADHYYRVLSAMNDGQRPRVGGRELSVADVNVQNVSQGLSAAVYGSGGSGQGLPGMSDTGAGDDGQDGNPGNQAPPHQGQGHQGQGHQGQERHDRGQRQDRGQDRGQDRNQDRGQDRNQDRQDRNQGQQRHNQNQGRQNQAHPNQGQHQPNQGQQPSGNVAANGHGGGYGNDADMSEQPAVSYAAAPVTPPPTIDEQPDYPEELLPTAVATPAPEAPEAAPEGQPRARGPRTRLRSPARRKPAEGAAGGTEPGGE